MILSSELPSARYCPESATKMCVRHENEIFFTGEAGEAGEAQVYLITLKIKESIKFKLIF